MQKPNPTEINMNMAFANILEYRAYKLSLSAIIITRIIDDCVIAYILFLYNTWMIMYLNKMRRLSI